MSRERRMDRIADQLTGALRQFFRELGRYRQRHILELPYPAHAILRRDDQTWPIRPIGAAAMPERSLRDRQRSRWHHQLYRVGPVAEIAIRIRCCLVAEVGRLHRPST